MNLNINGKCAQLDGFLLLNNIKQNKGFYKIYYAFHRPTGKYNILKLINDRHKELSKFLVKNELAKLKILNHKNIISFIEYKEQGKYIKKNEKEKFVDYMIFEECLKGTFMDFIGKTLFPEILVKHFYRQIIDVINYLQSIGIIHGNINPDNILLDNNYNIKLINFSQSFFINEKEDKNKKNKEITLRNNSYLPPEYFINADKKNDDDVFSSTVTLFVMLTKKLPFFKFASPTDEYYKFIFANRWETYWNDIIDIKKYKISEELKLLFRVLLSFESSERLNTYEIINSDWLKQNMEIENDLPSFFSKSKLSIENQLQMNKNQKEILKKKSKKEGGNFSLLYNGAFSFRSLSFDPLNIKKELEIMNREFLDSPNTFFIEMKEENIYNLLECLASLPNLKEIKNDKTYYRFYFQYSGNDEHDTFVLKVKFYAVDNQIAIKLSRDGGCSFTFMKIIDYFTIILPEFSNPIV